MARQPWGLSAGVCIVRGKRGPPVFKGLVLALPAVNGQARVGRTGRAGGRGDAILGAERGRGVDVWRYMRGERRVGAGVVVGGEVETRQLGGGQRIAALDRVQRDVVAVGEGLAFYMLRRELSFLCGRRREGELHSCSSGDAMEGGGGAGRGERRAAQRQLGRRGRMY